jgi:hypothetical protein
MPASNLATIFQPGLLRVRPAPGSASPTPFDDPNDVKTRIEADAREHKQAQAVLEFMISHQSSFELELPANLAKPVKPSKPKSSKDRAGSIPVVKLSQPSTSQSKTEEEVRGGPARLVRRGSDKSEDRRRMRRKKLEEKRLAEAGQASVKRSNTLPTAARAAPSSEYRLRCRLLAQTRSQAHRQLRSRCPPSSNAPPTSPIPSATSSDREREKERRWYQRSSKPPPPRADQASPPAGSAPRP